MIWIAGLSDEALAFTSRRCGRCVRRKRVRLAYRLDLNFFRGMETLQLRVEDMQAL